MDFKRYHYCTIELQKNIHTFIACGAEYPDAKTVLYGAPFDSTASYRPGARFAPSAIRNESFGIETYSPYLDKDLCDISVFDGGDLEMPFGNPAKALDIITGFTENILNDSKLPFMLGGEHLVTLGAVRAVFKKEPGLRIVHFDAHADLRNDYLGEELSHSTVMRRCYDILGDGRIFQFGIRSGDREEFHFGKGKVFTKKFNFDGLREILGEIKNYPVYFTLDLDVLDSAVFPGTGTPEAGGVSFMELMSAVTEVSKLNIVGLDMNELCPVCDQSGASTALACKLLREILLLIN
jgi:agmatinase